MMLELLSHKRFSPAEELLCNACVASACLQGRLCAETRSLRTSQRAETDHQQRLVLCRDSVSRQLGPTCLKRLSEDERSQNLQQRSPQASAADWGLDDSLAVQNIIGSGLQPQPVLTGNKVIESSLDCQKRDISRVVSSNQASSEGELLRTENRPTSIVDSNVCVETLRTGRLKNGFQQGHLTLNSVTTNLNSTSGVQRLVETGKISLQRGPTSLDHHPTEGCDPTFVDAVVDKCNTALSDDNASLKTPKLNPRTSRRTIEVTEGEDFWLDTSPDFWEEIQERPREEYSNQPFYFGVEPTLQQKSHQQPHGLVTSRTEGTTARTVGPTLPELRKNSRSDASGEKKSPTYRTRRIKRAGQALDAKTHGRKIWWADFDIDASLEFVKSDAKTVCNDASLSLTEDACAHTHSTLTCSMVAKSRDSIDSEGKAILFVRGMRPHANTIFRAEQNGSVRNQDAQDFSLSWDGDHFQDEHQMHPDASAGQGI